jgi:hypothetical protein
VKGTYRALGIITVLALLGAAARAVFTLRTLIGFHIFLIPNFVSPTGVEETFYYRSFTLLGISQIISWLLTIWAILAVTVAAQSRRTGWLATLLILIAVSLLLPYLEYIAYFGFGVPLTVQLARFATFSQWTLLAAALVTTIVFVVTRPRQTSSATIAVSEPAHTSATPDVPTL